MEGLPVFGEEDGPDDSSEGSKNKKSTSKTKNQSLGHELFSIVDKAEKPTEKPAEKTAEVNTKPLEIDKTPELNDEAPVEHLSRVEEEAINQTLAGEMLKDRHQEFGSAVEPEEMAVETFLENVEVSGEVEEAFNQTLEEIGIQPDHHELAELNFMLANKDAESEEVPEPPSQLPVEQREAMSKLKAEPESEDQHQVRPPRSRYYDTYHRQAEPVLSSVVDYLVDRRKGRLKSERKTAPLQARLEKEVVDLKSQLDKREIHIRQMVRRRTHPETVKLPVATIETKLQPERIGKVIVESQLPIERVIHRETKEVNQEAREVKETERIIEQEVVHDQPELGHLKAQTMNHAELLTLANRINIDGTNLRQVYEAHLLGEKGLRRVIAVFLRGGNVKRSLRRELIEREIDFERDPSLRDQATSQSITSRSSSLDSLLEQSGINWSDESTAPLPNRKQATIDPAGIVPPSHGVTLRRIADVVLIVILMIMVAIIIALILRK